MSSSSVFEGVVFTREQEKGIAEIQNEKRLTETVRVRNRIMSSISIICRRRSVSFQNARWCQRVKINNRKAATVRYYTECSLGIIIIPLEMHAFACHCLSSYTARGVSVLSSLSHVTSSFRRLVVLILIVDLSVFIPKSYQYNEVRIKFIDSKV